MTLGRIWTFRGYPDPDPPKWRWPVLTTNPRFSPSGKRYVFHWLLNLGPITIGWMWDGVFDLKKKGE